MPLASPLLCPTSRSGPPRGFTYIRPKRAKNTVMRIVVPAGT
jgi:hypothetical protein